jgi:hypothetical protein
MQGSASTVPSERIQKAIFLIRGQKVMLDKDLAELYGVSTSVLNKAVTRNIDRFPPDFMFRLTSEEFSDLKFHFGTSSWGGTRKRPRAFTEQGVAMLSSVLRSKRAVQVNIEIMRAFVRLREILASHSELARKLEELEERTLSILRTLRNRISIWLVDAFHNLIQIRCEDAHHTTRL